MEAKRRHLLLAATVQGSEVDDHPLAQLHQCHHHQEQPNEKDSFNAVHAKDMLNLIQFSTRGMHYMQVYDIKFACLKFIIVMVVVCEHR